MLCVEDYLDALDWAEQSGGLKGLIARSEASFAHIDRWVTASDWATFLAEEPDQRSTTSVCLKIKDPWLLNLDEASAASVPKKLAALLAGEGVALDIDGYRDAPPGLRVWCGATVDPEDVAALLPWLDWAYAQVKADLA